MGLSLEQPITRSIIGRTASNRGILNFLMSFLR
jgi:hypothetical protein